MSKNANRDQNYLLIDIFSTFRSVHTLIFPYVPCNVNGLHEEEANFYREKRSVTFVTGHFFLFFYDFISHLFGDYANINM